MTSTSDAPMPAESRTGWLELARHAARSDHARPTPEVRRELLAIEVGGGCHALPIERVREIVRPGAITRIPRTPAWIVGAIALRGEIVEVVDLGLRLRRAPTPRGPASRVVVIHAEDEGVAGLLVDSVSGVLRVSEQDFVGCEEADFRAVGGLVRVGGRFFGVIELDRVLEAEHGD